MGNFFNKNSKQSNPFKQVKHNYKKAQNHKKAEKVLKKVGEVGKKAGTVAAGGAAMIAGGAAIVAQVSTDKANAETVNTIDSMGNPTNLNEQSKNTTSTPTGNYTYYNDDLLALIVGFITKKIWKYRYLKKDLSENEKKSNK